MVGCKIRVIKKNHELDWVDNLLRSKFFGSCLDHGGMRKNEKNLFCIDCNLCLCKHCVASSSHHRCFHRVLQICKYVYRNVVRLHDIQPHLDCSLIQAYKINGEKAVHLNPRPQLKDAKSSKTKGGGICCEAACGRHIQDLPNRFCSIACKVSGKGTKIIASSVETEENSYEKGYGSLTESSSEVIQSRWISGSRSKTKRLLHKRKSLPRRSPLS